MNKEIRKFLAPNNDIVFKRLFGKKGNERLIKDFLEAILNIEIETVDLGKEVQLQPERIEQKLGILDVRVTLKDGTKIDVEMQNINYGNIEQRLTYYCSLLYVEDLARGEDYKELNKTIAIGILNFEYFKEIKEYHTVWKMTEQKNKNKTLEEQEIHFIELPKFLKSKINIDNKLEQWLLFIDYSRKELLKMAEEKNKIIKEANVEYEYLTGDEELRRIAFLKRKYELDYNSGISYAKREAEKKGEEKGIKKGIKKGIIDVAKKMLEMNFKIEDISEATGLSIEEIENLKKILNN